MKYIIVLMVSIYSGLAWSCVDLSGTFIDVIQEHGNQIDLKVVKQDACKSVKFHNAFYDPDSDFYHEAPNGTLYKLDGKVDCDAFGFCKTASIDEEKVYVKHDTAEFNKADGNICVSNAISFSRDNKKSLVVVRECNDDTLMKAIFKVR